jgi:uncharacterized membrane protein YoaT (DUF817 family)
MKEFLSDNSVAIGGAIGLLFGIRNAILNVPVSTSIESPIIIGIVILIFVWLFENLVTFLIRSWRDEDDLDIKKICQGFSYGFILCSIFSFFLFAIVLDIYSGMRYGGEYKGLKQTVTKDSL